MENKFTKGPWKWQKFGSYYNLTAQHGMREIIISANLEFGSGYPFVSMNEDGILEPVNPENPNAKLIAAAPDLIEACIIARKEMQKNGITYDNANIYNKIDKAIKKATE